MAEGQFDIGEEFDALMGDDAPAIEPAAPENPVADIEDAFDAIEARDRDEKGRFKAKEEAVDPAADPAPVAEPEKPAEAVAETPEAAPVIDAPKHLPAKLAEHWAELSPDVQAAIIQREKETHEVVTRVDRERQVGRGFDAAAAEFKDVIDHDGGGQPITAVRNLLNTARVLREGSADQKVAMLNQIATMYDINIEQAYYSRPAPEVAQAQIALQQRDAELAHYRAQEAQAVSGQIQQTIEQFAADKPHFFEVAPEMERLARAGVSQDLQTLYNMAMGANENLRSASIEQAVADRLAAEEASRAAQVAKARRAAISPTSAPGTAKPPGSSKLSPEEQIALDYDRIMAASD